MLVEHVSHYNWVSQLLYVQLYIEGTTHTTYFLCENWNCQVTLRLELSQFFESNDYSSSLWSPKYWFFKQGNAQYIPLFESHHKYSHCKFHASHGSNFSRWQLNHNEFLTDFHDCIFLKQPNGPCKCKTRFSHEMLELLYDIRGN